MYLLGYDLGSSSVKVSLLNADTNEALGTEQYPEAEMDIISRQNGWAEQQPEVWWQNLIMATRKLFAKLDVDTADIKGVGLSYQMHGLVLLDKDLNVLRPAIIWCDSRAVEIGKAAYNDLGKEYCQQHLLNSPSNFTASKLKWVKDNEPTVYSRVYKCLLPGDYIAYKLTGQLSTTISGLSECILWDFKHKRLATEVLDYYEISSDLLCESIPTFGIQGRLTKEAAAYTGLRKGTPLSYRAGDQPTNALALNVMNPNEIAATSGTSGVVYGIMDQPMHDNLSRVNSFAHVNYEHNFDRIGVLLCLNGAGIQYSWMKNQIARTDRNYKDMERMVSSVPVGSNGLCILPFGNGAERMLENKNINSHIFNIQFNRHDRAHLYRAALEGVAFSFVHGVNILKELGLEVGVLKVGNDNMFQSETFSMTIANLLNCNIEVIDTTTALGAARAAGVGAGVYSSIDEALQGINPLAVYKPNYDTSSCQRAYAYWQSCLKKVLPENKSHVKDAHREVLWGMEEKLEENSKDLMEMHMKMQIRDEFLQDVKNDLRLLPGANGNIQKQIEKITRKIDWQLDKENRWADFEEHFNMVHGDFFKTLKATYPELSLSDVKLLALLKVKMNTKDIANQLNLSVRGVETRRYRLRKKLKLEKGAVLGDFIEVI